MSRRDGFDIETLRGLAVRALIKRNNTQWTSFVDAVTVEARTGRLMTAQESLTSGEEDALQAVVWALIAQGVLVPGPNAAGNEGWPFFRVTAFGRQALTDGTPTPHDPDGYLKRLRNDVPAVAQNPDYDLYIGEALNAFIGGSFVASVLMVGVAAELAAEQLAEALIHWLPTKEAASIRGIQNWKVAERFEEMRKRLEPRKPKLPKEYAQDFEVHLLGIAVVLRRNRNSAGHPTGRRYSRGEAFSFLQTLPSYLKFLHDLAAWMLLQPAGSG